MVTSEIKKKAKGAIPYSFGISAFQVLIALFGMVLLVRYLDAKQYGLFALITGLPLVLNVYISLGYDAFITRFVPSKPDDPSVGEVVWSIITRRVFVTVAVSTVLLLGFDLYAEPFSFVGFYQHVAVGQAFTLTEAAYMYLVLAFEARFLQKNVLYLAVFHQGLRVLGIWIGIELEMGLLFFITVFAVASALNLLSGVIGFSRRHGLPQPQRMLHKIEESVDEKSYRRVNYVNTIGMSFLGTNIDCYLLAYFSTTLQVAIYSVATRVLTALLTFYPLKMFRSVAAPALFTKYDKGQSGRDLKQMFRLLFNANTVFGFMALAIFIPAGSELLQLVFDNAYAVDAYWLLVIFLGFLVLYHVPLALVVTAIKEPKILLISKLSILVNLALGIPLAIHYGALGMAVGTLAGNVTKNAIIYLCLVKHVRVTIPWSRVARAVLNAGATAALLHLAKEVAGLHALAIVPLGAAIYVAIMKVMPILELEESKIVVSLAPGRLQKLASALL